MHFIPFNLLFEIWILIDLILFTLSEREITQPKFMKDFKTFYIDLDFNSSGYEHFDLKIIIHSRNSLYNSNNSFVQKVIYGF